jgi:DNA-nicking Smr family endonuclease
VARKKPRHLSPEERALWDEVAKSARPMRPDRPQTAQEAIAPKPAPDRAKIDRFDLGERSQTRLPDHSIAPKIEEEIARAPVSMDRKRFTQMKRGKMRPEARIDLHGLTLAHAHPVLMRFILESVAEGRRLVLVITGKGRTRQNDGPIPERHGVLRHQVPHWLHTPPLKAHVLQISEAHVKHGGLGAYYVYLRRAR